MNKICPHCGTELHEDAVFCPHCTEILNKRIEFTPPKKLSHKLILSIIALIVVAAFLLTAYIVSRPKEYESGKAEILYIDGDTTYQLLLGYADNRFEPCEKYQTTVQEGGEFRFPVCIFVNNESSGRNEKDNFEKKVKSISAKYINSKNSKLTPKCTEPKPEDYCKDALAVTFIDFIGSDNEATLCVTITMKNGDIIRIHQPFQSKSAKIVTYTPDEYPMNTAKELQALFDEIAEIHTGPTTIVKIQLPEYTYDGELTLSRSVELYGSHRDNRRTTFKKTLHIQQYTGFAHLMNIEGIDFVGDGTSIAISSASVVHINDCGFFHWKTGILGFGNNWINIQNSTFKDNNIGFHFNSTGTRVSHTVYAGNKFINNGTAIYLERIPNEVSLKFPQCEFKGNIVDIENPLKRGLDLSKATFS